MLSAAKIYVPQCGPEARSTRRAALLAWLLLMTCALLLVLLLLAAPWSVAHGYEAFGRTIYGGFGYVCHQIPSRSFYLAGHPFAVCARCTGIYTGFALGVALYPLLSRLRRTTETPSRKWLLVGLAPLAIDFALGFFGILENTHFSRLLTGAFFGAVCAFFIVPASIEMWVSRRRTALSAVATKELEEHAM